MSSYRESATPIFDEVDRRWREAGGDDDALADDPLADDAATAPPSMLSFAGTPSPTTPATPAGGGGRTHGAPGPDGSPRTVLSLITAARREPGPRHALRR